MGRVGRVGGIFSLFFRGKNYFIIFIFTNPRAIFFGPTLFDIHAATAVYDELSLHHFDLLDMCRYFHLYSIGQSTVQLTSTTLTKFLMLFLIRNYIKTFLQTISIQLCLPRYLC